LISCLSFGISVARGLPFRGRGTPAQTASTGVDFRMVIQ
jgi:hypothetical protein